MTRSINREYKNCMKFKLVILIVTLFFSMSAARVLAFSVDKMMIMSDKNGNGIITLKNDDSHSIFIQSKIQEVTIPNGQDIIRTDYIRDNLRDWKVSLTHPKLVLKPGEEKDVGIRSLCRNTSCDNAKDLMFMLQFTPAVYSYDNKKKSGIEINYGFSPLYIIPTNLPVYAYDISNDGGTLRVNNRGNTMLNIFVDACNSGNPVNCKQKFIVLAGRDRVFELNKTLQSPYLKVTISSYDNGYSVTESVNQY